VTIVIGIVAEDSSDAEVIQKLIQRYRARRPRRFEKRQGGGCARLRAKCRSYGEDLARRGCTRLIIVHDADENDPQSIIEDIRTRLETPSIALFVIVVPVHEIEAWLLSDPNAIKIGLNLRSPAVAVPNAESIRRPKEHLRDLIFRWSGKRLRYINTVHNIRIAEKCDVQKLMRCDSYLAFDQFVRSNC
jgi:hypothetical protein